MSCWFNVARMLVSMVHTDSAINSLRCCFFLARVLAWVLMNMHTGNAIRQLILLAVYCRVMVHAGSF